MLPAQPPTLVAAETAQSQSDKTWLFALVITAFTFLGRYLLPRYWPSQIIHATIDRGTKAQAWFKDLNLERISEQEIELGSKAFGLINKARALRQRHDEILDSGFIKYLRSWKALYTDARALKKAMDNIELHLDEENLCRRQSAFEIMQAWMNRAQDADDALVSLLPT